KKTKDSSGIDLLAEDVLEDLPPLSVPELPMAPGEGSGINPREEDILLEGERSGSHVARGDSSRDPIAEAVEAGLDLLGGDEKKKKRLEDLDAFDLDSLTPSDDSSSVDLGSLPNMPTADVVLGKKEDESAVELGAGLPPSSRRLADDGIDLEAAP